MLSRVSSIQVSRWPRQQVGFVDAVHQGKGGHLALFKRDGQGQNLLVPGPRRVSIPAGALTPILTQSGLPREAFIDLLSR